jgi:hypothetical protein
VKQKHDGNDEEAMNKELLEWIKEAKEQPNKKQDQDAIKKEPVGTCEICGKNESKFVCLKCERSVCPSCYFKIIGICKSCTNKEIMEKWEGKQPDWGEILGVQWVD